FTPTPTTSSTTRSARRPRCSTSRPCTSTWCPDQTRSGWSTGSSPVTPRSWPSAARSTPRGATKAARSSTAADPQLRWLRQNSSGLDVTVTEETEATAALALQGPLSREVLEAATRESFADLRYFRRRASKVGKVKVDVSRTGYTGDRGYELWIPGAGAVKVWDALMAAGAAYGIRPAGML